MNFVRLYIGDYMRDTGTLTVAEHGAYMLMLMHYYATEKPIPSGRALHRLLRAETKAVGVRVCCVHPGATWSPSWSASGVAPERIMPAADVARAFLDVYRLTRTTVVEEIVLRPQLGDL